MVRPIKLVAFFFMLQSSIALAALTATVDKTSIASGEPFRLSVTSDTDVSGSPDLSPLEKDFDILAKGQSQNISIINGSVSRETSWNLTLMPKQAGKLTIPALSLGKEKTSPVVVNVGQAGDPKSATESDKTIFLETQWDKPTAQVGEQRILTVKLYRAINTGAASLTEPESDQAIIRKLAKDKVYESEKNGRRYRVNERRYAVFPQKPGKLVIKPVQFQGRIPTGRRRASPFSMFDDFGVDMDSFMVGGKPVRVWSPSMRLTVSEIPPGASADKWLPAKDVQLIQRWEPASPQFKVGEPITRIISLLVDGQPLDQLIDLPVWVTEGIKRYPDKPVENEQVTDDGIISIREFRDVLVPEKKGEFRLPEVKVRWWDSAAEKFRTTEIKAQTITVSGSSAGSDITSEIRPAQQPDSELAASTTADLPDARQAKSVPSVTAQSNGSIWQWVSLALALIWLATITIWFYVRRKTASRIPITGSGNNDEKVLYKTLTKTLQSEDLASVETALIRWAANIVSDKAITSIGHLVARLDDKDDRDLIERIKELERVRYRSSEGAQCNYHQLKSAIDRWRSRQKQHTAHENTRRNLLKPLYQST